MPHSHSIRIGPEFFRKTFNDYSDWQSALVREILQNSSDAPGSTAIDVSVRPEGDNTQLIVTNNGAPMTEDVLVNKLLALGGSGKDFLGTVGGFGRAKELVYLCQLRYEIHTGNLRVVGSGASYDLEEVDHFPGTCSTILVAGDHLQTLLGHFHRFITLSRWAGTFAVNGTVIGERLPQSKFRRDLGWARVYTNKAHSNLLVVSIGGLPMFTRRTSYPGCVVAELAGKSRDVLQSSRDGLKWRQSEELDQFVRDLSVNRRKALQAPTVQVIHYPGLKLGIAASGDEAADEPLSARADSELSSSGFRTGLVVTGVEPAEPVDHDGCSTIRQAVATMGSLGMEFVVKNDTGMSIQAYYLPESFGSYARLLVRRWRAVLLELARLLDHREPFALGFYFSADLEAAHERSRRHGHVLYVNPVRVTANPGGSRSFAKRWKFDARGNWQLLATAVHEWCHFEGLAEHDDVFACRQTDLTALVLQDLKRFGRLFDRGGAR